MAEWIGIGLIAIGLIVSIVFNSRTIVANGKTKSEEYGALKKDVENINKKLDDPRFGLNALHAMVGNFTAHCAEVSGELAGRVKALEKSRRRK